LRKWNFITRLPRSQITEVARRPEPLKDVRKRPNLHAWTPYRGARVGRPRLIPDDRHNRRDSTVMECPEIIALINCTAECKVLDNSQ
jgi:hypothetical protein